jgi:riboflavin synthase
MFTGIIEQQARIQNIENGEFTIKNPLNIQDLTIGQSIAHDGACMTLTDITPESYSFFAMEETLNRTNFGGKKVGDTFNIERCMRMDSRLDGHFVTGHIDTTGRVKQIEDRPDNSRVITISFPSEHAGLLVEK